VPENIHNVCKIVLDDLMKFILSTLKVQYTMRIDNWPTCRTDFGQLAERKMANLPNGFWPTCRICSKKTL